MYNQPIKSMKILKFIAILFLATFEMSACTPNMKFLTSSVVPAATGEVKVKKDKNENYAINVNVLNLAEPQKLTPAKDKYIVWMEDGKNPVKKLGQIDSSSGTFSKALKGSLSATSVAEPTKVFITAENNAEVTYPTGEVVLTTKK